MSELSEELLVAYVDGQLARAQSVAVKRVIDFDDVASERVGSLRNANKRLEEAFEAMLRERPEEETDDAPAAEPQPATQDAIVQDGAAPSALAVLLGNHGALVVGGAALALLLLGGGVGYFITSGSSVGNPSTPVISRHSIPDWQKEIAQTQALFGRETLEISLESQANRELVRFQLANALGPGIVVPDLEALGLKFVRAQLLRRAGVPIAQISYLPKQGPPIALYAKAQTGPGTGAGGGHAEAGVETRSFVHNGIIYVIAAGLPEGEVAKLAGAVKQKLSAP